MLVKLCTYCQINKQDFNSNLCLHFKYSKSKINIPWSKRAVFGSEITLQIKAIKRLPFIFQASEPTEKPFENCTKHFLLPLYSIVWDYNSKQKRQHKYSLEQDTLFWEQEGENMFAALCDDDKYIIEELKKLLLTYAKENRIIIDIDEFESGEKLFKFRE